MVSAEAPFMAIIITVSPALNPVEEDTVILSHETLVTGVYILIMPEIFCARQKFETPKKRKLKNEMNVSGSFIFSDL